MPTVASFCHPKSVGPQFSETIKAFNRAMLSQGLHWTDTRPRLDMASPSETPQRGGGLNNSEWGTLHVSKCWWCSDSNGKQPFGWKRTEHLALFDMLMYYWIQTATVQNQIPAGRWFLFPENLQVEVGELGWIGAPVIPLLGYGINMSQDVWNILKPPATEVNLSGASDLCWCCLLPGPIFAIAPGQPHHAKEKEPGHCGGIKLLWLALQSPLKAWELGSSHPYTSGYIFFCNILYHL